MDRSLKFLRVHPIPLSVDCRALVMVLRGSGKRCPHAVDAGEVQEDISGAVYYIFSKMSLISTSIEQASTGLQNANSNFEAQDSATAEATPGRAAR